MRVDYNSMSERKQGFRYFVFRIHSTIISTYITRLGHDCQGTAAVPQRRHLA
jgi:hypothetical protein